MTERKDEVFDAVLQAVSVQVSIRIISDHFDVQYVTFHMVSSASSGLNNPFVRTTYPADWVSHYLLNNFVASDPILRFAMSANRPFCWSEIEPADDAERRILAEASQFGLGDCGFSIPCSDSLGRKSVLSLNSDQSQDDWQKFLARHRDDLIGLSRDLHVQAVAEAFAEQAETRHLSPRELECLRWTAEGKTYSEIAIILDLSEHTVRSYLKLARLKLESVSLAQAAAKASRMGLI